MTPFGMAGFIVALLLCAAGMLVAVALVGFLGGFQELTPTAEDEVLVRHVRRTGP